MLAIHFMALSSITDMLAGILELLKNPVLVPLGISGITWLVDKYTTLTEGMNEWIKRGLILVVPAALAWLVSLASTAFGYPLDLSSITAAGGSLVAMIIYLIGQKKMTA